MPMERKRQAVTPRPLPARVDAVAAVLSGLRSAMQSAYGCLDLDDPGMFNLTLESKVIGLIAAGITGMIVCQHVMWESLTQRAHEGAARVHAVFELPTV